MPDTGGPSIYAASLRLADPTGHFQLGAQVASRQQAMQLEAQAQAFRQTMSLFDMTNQAAQQIVKNRQIDVEQNQAQQRINNGMMESQQRLAMTRQHQAAQEQYWKNGRNTGSGSVANTSVDAAMSYPTTAGNTAMPVANSDAPLLPEDAANLQKNAEVFRQQYGYDIADVDGFKQAMNQGDANSANESALGMMEGYAAMQMDAQDRANKAAASEGPSNALVGPIGGGAGANEATATPTEGGDTHWFNAPDNNHPYTDYKTAGGKVMRKEADFNPKTGQWEYAKRAMRDVTIEANAAPPPPVPKEGEPPVAGLAPGDEYFPGGTALYHRKQGDMETVQPGVWDDKKGRVVPKGVVKTLPMAEPDKPITVGDQIGVPVQDSSGKWKYKFYQPEPDVAAKISSAKAQGFDIAGYTVSNGKVTVRAVAPKDPLTVAGAPDDLISQIKGITGAPKNYILQANATLYDPSKYVDPQTGEASPMPTMIEKLNALGRDPNNPGTVTEEDWNKGYFLAMQARREQAAKTINNTIASLKGGVAKGAQWYLSHADAIISGSGAAATPPPATDSLAASAQPSMQPSMQPAPAATPPVAAKPALIDRLLRGAK